MTTPRTGGLPPETPPPRRRSLPPAHGRCRRRPVAVADPAAVARARWRAARECRSGRRTPHQRRDRQFRRTEIAASIASRGFSFRMRTTGGVNTRSRVGGSGPWWPAYRRARRRLLRLRLCGSGQIRRDIAVRDRNDAEMCAGRSLDSGCNQDQHDRSGVQQSGNQSGTFRRCVHERLTRRRRMQMGRHRGRPVFPRERRKAVSTAEAATLCERNISRVSVCPRCAEIRRSRNVDNCAVRL